MYGRSRSIDIGEDPQPYCDANSDLLELHVMRRLSTLLAAIDSEDDVITNPKRGDGGDDVNHFMNPFMGIGRELDFFDSVPIPNMVLTRSEKKRKGNNDEETIKEGGMMEGCPDGDGYVALAHAGPLVGVSNLTNVVNNADGISDNVRVGNNKEGGIMEGRPADAVAGVLASLARSPADHNNFMNVGNNFAARRGDNVGVDVNVGIYEAVEGGQIGFGGEIFLPASHGEYGGGGNLGIEMRERLHIPPPAASTPLRRVRAAPVLAKIGTVLFLMPDLDEVEGNLLKLSLHHERWLKYYEGILTGVDGVVRVENDTLIFGDEMFLVALEVARADLSMGREILYDLNDPTPCNYKKCADDMNSVLRHICFMNAR